ncbi:MAG: hypothetical protein ACK2T3_14045 [Candidatus Promineifilaceae bacterium]
MRTWLGIFVVSLAVAGLVGCGESQPVEQLPEVAGPALVMFYTDN